MTGANGNSSALSANAALPALTMSSTLAARRQVNESFEELLVQAGTALTKFSQSSS